MRGGKKISELSGEVTGQERGRQTAGLGPEGTTSLGTCAAAAVGTGACGCSRTAPAGAAQSVRQWGLLTSTAAQKHRAAEGLPEPGERIQGWQLAEQAVHKGSGAFSDLGRAARKLWTMANQHPQ